MDIMVDYYKILDVPQSASLADIKRAYRSKVLRWHPDKNPDNRTEAEQKFKEVVEAYKVLSDRSTRDHYDGSSKDIFKGTKRSEAEKHLFVFDQDGIKIFFTGQRFSSDFSVSFFSAPKRFHHFSIMTAFINGKKITTKRHLENESKYLEVEEEGKTVSIHVNGIPMYDRETRNEWDYRLDKGHHYSEKWCLWTCEKRRWAEEWRRWANKWRNWAEECRDWAEERRHQGDNGSSGSTSRCHRTDAERPKVNEEYPKSDKGCPKPGGKYHGFPMPGEGKTTMNEANSNTNKRQPWPEQEHTRPDKGYFMFPKPGERNSSLDEEHLRATKRHHKPEKKDNLGLGRTGERHIEQDEGHAKTKTGQPKPEEQQSRFEKVYNGLQKPGWGSPSHKKTDPLCSEAPVKHKMDSESNLQIETQKLHVREEEQQTEDNSQHAVKIENTPRKNEQNNEKLKHSDVAGGSTFESEPEKGTEVNGLRRKSSANAKGAHKPQLATCSTKESPLKRRESQIRPRKPYTKKSKSQTGRSKSCNSRNRPQAGKNRMPDGQTKAGPEGSGLSNGSREVSPGEKKTSVDCKCTPQNRKKGSLPPLQEDGVLTKKKLLRRTHHLTSETKSEKQRSVSETSQVLDINSQQKGKPTKMSQSNSRLPSIRGQKFGINQLPNMTC